MKRSVILIGISLMVSVSCSSPSSQSKAVEVVSETAADTLEIYSPSVPMMITSANERVNYLSMHYWDDFDIKDSLLIANTAVVEQAWANYIAFLNKLPAESVPKSLKATMEHASASEKGLEVFLEVSEKYLYHPNSPMRNEEFFIPILEYIIGSDKVDGAMKIRPRRLLELANLNRVGSAATDFKYTLTNGKSASLYSIKADYTIIFFNNPDCEDCKRIKGIISNSQLLRSLTIQRGTNGNTAKLTILGLVPDVDLDIWHNTQYPDILINAYDQDVVIYANDLYDLKALPTLYLLDADKRVILKDSSIENIIGWLGSHAIN